MKKILLIFLLFFFSENFFVVTGKANEYHKTDKSRKAVTVMSVEELLQSAYRKNPSLQAAKHRFSSERALVTAKIFPDSPVLSSQKLHRNQTTTYRGFSQRIRFPVKYFLEARAQKSLAHSRQSQWQWEKMAS